MHMNSAPHLLSGDRPDFERVLDKALHSEATRSALSGGGNPLNTEQLRTMALSAAELISACAAPEYLQYLNVREQIRRAAEDRLRVRHGGIEYVAAVGPMADPPGSGPGLFAIIAVLTPILAAAAAVIFLLLGYALSVGGSPPAIAKPLQTAGWLFAAVAAAGAVFGMAGLLLTALRNGATALHDRPEESPPEVATARAAWKQALLERGLQPFIQEALAKAATNATTPPGPAPAQAAGYSGNAGGPRMPRLGYSSPDFSSPGPEESPEPGHRFSSPDYSSPDFSSPDYSSPDFGGPDNKPE
jgi:hypothetical protein